MSEKNINSRIQHKHDTEANWLKATNFIPKAGELIVYDVDENYNYPRIKIGDGQLNINNLKFINDNNISFTQTLTSGTKIGSIDINGTSTSIYAPKKITVDSALSSTSTNPVQNKVIDTKFTEVDEGVEKASQAAMVALPGSLKWDGVIGDRDCVLLAESSDEEGAVQRQSFVHISDYVPALFEIAAGADEETLPILTTMGGIFGALGMGVSLAEVPINPDKSILSEFLAFIPTDNYSIEGLIFPKKGWYFMHVAYVMGDIEIPIAYINGLKIMGMDFPDNSGGDASKYFETVTNKKPLEITWDGSNVDDKVVVVVDGLSFAKVSSVVPTLEELEAGGTISVGNNSYSLNDTENVQIVYEGNVVSIGVATGDPAIPYFPAGIIIPTDNGTIMGTTFPEAGIYAIRVNGGFSLIVNDYFKETGEIIKTEHLPEALQFGKVSTYGDTLTWDGDIEGREIINGVIASTEVQYVKVSDATPSVSDVLRGTILTTTKADGTIETEIVPEEMIHLSADGMSWSAILVMVLFSDQIIEGVYASKGIYFLQNSTTGVYSSSLTINGYNGFKTTTFKTIDPKYLPEGIGGSDSGSVDLVVSEHNTDNSAHNDIRDLIDDLSTRLNALADSDDTTLDQMSEIVAYIKNNKNLIDSVTTSKVSVSDIINNLTTNVTNKPLSAAQGVAIKSLINALQTEVDGKSDSNHTHNYAGSSSIGGAATSANKLTTARTISLSGAVSGSTSFDGSKNVTITTTNGQHISNRGSGTYYYKLGTMVADNASNYGNITISGRLGGWEQSNSANFDIMMLNRSSAKDGNTITATVSASGNTVGAFGSCDIVVYRQDDTSEIVYLKLNGYWLYDFDWSVFQHSVDYSATNVTPTGTLVWSLSAAPKTILSADGTLSATKFSGTIENATKATKDASGNVITDTYMTKVNPTGSGNVSIGRKSGTTIGDKSVVIGTDATASNKNTVAIGYNASATNDYGVAIGYGAVASGEQSTAIGTAPKATGKQSTALGVQTTASGEYATSMGCWTTSAGIAGTSLGNGSTVDANSWGAVSSGIVTVARGLGQHVFGSYNIPDVAVENYSTPAEHLLIVGNGDVISDDGVQSNAMTLDWEGNAWFSGDVYVGSTSGTNKDSGSIKLSKEGHIHNYIPSVSSTNKAITRFNGTGGAVQNSKIIIEDTTNSRDNSKGQVIAIPTTGGKKMVYGLCTDQTDGTAFIGGLFGSSTTSYPYAEGLAIGGSSGNLLWKGAKVATIDDLSSKADSNHTHSYAGSSSVGGSATSATKLDSSAGSATQPVYFSGGKPVATTYTLGASVPSGAKFTDTTYSAATTSAAGLMSAADKAKLDGIATGATKITVDSALSSTSTNPVQNKAVNTAINNLNSSITTKVETALSEAKASGEFKGDKGDKGDTGAAGSNGYTPVRGTDYWTETDKAEIKSYVDTAILGGAW